LAPPVRIPGSRPTAGTPGALPRDVGRPEIYMAKSPEYMASTTGEMVGRAHGGFVGWLTAGDDTPRPHQGDRRLRQSGRPDNEPTGRSPMSSRASGGVEPTRPLVDRSRLRPRSSLRGDVHHHVVESCRLAGKPTDQIPMSRANAGRQSRRGSRRQVTKTGPLRREPDGRLLFRVMSSGKSGNRNRRFIRVPRDRTCRHALRFCSAPPRPVSELLMVTG